MGLKLDELDKNSPLYKAIQQAEANQVSPEVQNKIIADIGPAKAVKRSYVFPDGMNKTEMRYAYHLNDLQLAGKVLTWMFEPFSLRLAKKTFYRPDFMVVTDERLIEIHEVKGHWEDDARVKIKVAAKHFPMFKFKAIKSENNGWKIELFP